MVPKKHRKDWEYQKGNEAYRRGSVGYLRRTMENLRSIEVALWVTLKVQCGTEVAVTVTKKALGDTKIL